MIAIPTKPIVLPCYCAIVVVVVVICTVEVLEVPWPRDKGIGVTIARRCLGMISAIRITARRIADTREKPHSHRAIDVAQDRRGAESIFSRTDQSAVLPGRMWLGERL